MTRLFLTAKDVADLLKLNVLTVYGYIRKGRLKASKFGRNYRIEEKDLDTFIKEQQIWKKSR